MPDKFIDDYLEYLSNKGAALDDPLNGLRPLLRGYLQRSAQEAADADPNTRFALIPLASAGNFRPSLGSTPLAPARFPETIAVSATLGTFGNLWALSHDGNVRAPGAGYILAKDASGGVTRVGAGTYIAAPYVTTLAALWLTYPNACQFTGGCVPLTTDPTVKNTNSIAAIAGNSIFPLACSKNLPPVLSLTNSITMTEGQQLSIGTVSNAGGGAINLTSSLSGSSVVNVSGNVVFSHNDGPLAAQTVTITATNALGAQTSASFTLTVDNAAPTGQLGANTQTVTAGGTLTLTMGSPFDPGAVDTASGFNYAFDCGSGVGVVSTASTNTLICTYPTQGGFTAHGLIRVKDGAMGESTLPITVNPVSESPVCYATSVVIYVPGTRKNGTAIEIIRSDSTNALHAPQIVDSYNFVSLGFGDGLTTGLLILDLYPNAIQNGEGMDVRIWETSFNDSGRAWTTHPEAVHVFASQDLDTWVLLGTTTDKDQAYDLASLDWARYIKLVDVSNRANFGNHDDGFDVDAVEGFACLPTPSEEYYDESSSREAIVIVTEDAPIVDIPAEPTTEPAPVMAITAGASGNLKSQDNPTSLTHPIPLLDGSVYFQVTYNGDVAIWRNNIELARLPLNVLRDARPVVNNDGLIAVYAGATDQRYVHGILGDNQEASGLAIVKLTSSQFGIQLRTDLQGEDVFEGISPFWADVNEDGIEDLVTTVSNSTVGSWIRVYLFDGTQFTAEVNSTPLGQDSRWIHQIAFGPFGPNGENEIAAVRTPDINGAVQFLRYNAETNALDTVGEKEGYTSHMIGSRNVDMAVAGDFNGDGQPELVLPAQDRTRIVGVQHTAEGVLEMWSLPVNGRIVTNLTAVVLNDNSLALAYGTDDGRLRVWLPDAPAAVPTPTVAP